MDRRGFLKLTGMAATALVAARAGVVAYDEPIIRAPYANWIHDKGDWFEVFVPAGKTLAAMEFTKPVLLILGRAATFSDCAVQGFVNVHAAQGGIIRDSHINTTGVVSKLGDRAALRVVKSSALVVLGCSFVSPGAYSIAQDSPAFLNYRAVGFDRHGTYYAA